MDPIILTLEEFAAALSVADPSSVTGASVSFQGIAGDVTVKVTFSTT